MSSPSAIQSFMDRFILNNILVATNIIKISFSFVSLPLTTIAQLNLTHLASL